MKYMRLFEEYNIDYDDWDEEDDELDFTREELIKLVNHKKFIVNDSYDYVIDKMNDTLYRDLNGYITGEFRMHILRGDGLIREGDNVFFKTKKGFGYGLVRDSGGGRLKIYNNGPIGYICGIKSYRCILAPS